MQLLYNVLSVAPTADHDYCVRCCINTGSKRGFCHEKNHHFQTRTDDKAICLNPSKQWDNISVVGNNFIMSGAERLLIGIPPKIGQAWLQRAGFCFLDLYWNWDGELCFTPWSRVGLTLSMLVEREAAGPFTDLRMWFTCMVLSAPQLPSISPCKWEHGHSAPFIKSLNVAELRSFQNVWSLW